MMKTVIPKRIAGKCAAALQRVITGLKPFKPYVRWVILGGVLFFLAQALKDNWCEVMAIHVNRAGFACLMISLGVTLLAHIWSGWVWSWIVEEFNQSSDGVWGVQVYLKTNIAKYLPGNVWHFYGRVRAVQELGVSSGNAILSVLMEPMLMAAAAILIALLSSQQRWGVQVIPLAAVLICIHPRILNPVLLRISQTKAKMQGLGEPDTSPKVKRYPLRPLLGEIGFVFLRGLGFVLAVLALKTISPLQILPLISAFSLAWVFGLVVPGAPGGVGVFEATAIALLNNQLSTGVILGSVAFYRLISTLAEAGGAGLVWLDERWSQRLVS
ncbi:MAG: UPF0104 family protein [Leptolyngbyaceae cyanobacterium MO_188.B28]|nr:UPF0104 family protein [Leptolyngbyaceae cyanobacterium MO_188.B28]